MRTEPPNVLVVDDDESMRCLAVEAINRLGHVAVGRADADSALQVLRVQPTIQVLLSDICLEAGTGPDLVRQALRDRPDLKVIFMTGGFSDISFRRTDPVLSKPFGLDGLKQALDNVLNKPQAAPDRTQTVSERRRLGVSE